MVGYPVYVRLCNLITCKHNSVLKFILNFHNIKNIKGWVHVFIIIWLTKSGPQLYRTVAAVGMPQRPRFLLMTQLLTRSRRTWRHLVHKSRRVDRVYNCTSLNMDQWNIRPDLQSTNIIGIENMFFRTQWECNEKGWLWPF